MPSVPITSELAPAADVPETSLLSEYWQPRYWPAWFLIGLLRATAALPWRVAIALYKRLGLCLWVLLRSRRRSVERNIGRRYPDLDNAEISAMSRQYFQNLSACLAETAFAWFGRVDESRIPFHIEGDEHVLSALKAGHGVILYTGHFTSIEICGTAVKNLFPTVAIMFHRRQNPLFDEWQRRGRLHSSHILVADDNVRAMLTALRQGAVVWYASDQSHSHHAQRQRRRSDDLEASDTTKRQRRRSDDLEASDTTTCRIARLSDAVVVPLSYHRRSDDSGYVIRFGPALYGFPTNRDTARATELDEVLRKLIAECPEQYGWTYKRLRIPERKPSAEPVANRI